jgi:DNA-binding response OmpR family regulator
MPTYNRADLLPRSIASILSQGFDDFEFLIVDDEPRWLDFARRELRNQYEVEVASEKPVAVDRICTGHYDLVIVSARRLDTLELIQRECPSQRIAVTTIQQTTQEA